MEVWGCFVALRTGIGFVSRVCLKQETPLNVFAKSKLENKRLKQSSGRRRREVTEQEGWNLFYGCNFM
jgi:hypothetical protein